MLEHHGGDSLSLGTRVTLVITDDNENSDTSIFNAGEKLNDFNSDNKWGIGEPVMYKNPSNPTTWLEGVKVEASVYDSETNSLIFIGTIKQRERPPSVITRAATFIPEDSSWEIHMNYDFGYPARTGNVWFEWKKDGGSWVKGGELENKDDQFKDHSCTLPPLDHDPDSPIEYKFQAFLNYTNDQDQNVVEEGVVERSFYTFPDLVGYWNLNDSSGDVAFDTSPVLLTKNDGKIFGELEPSWVFGHSGNALSFDGINDYVAVPDADRTNI